MKVLIVASTLSFGGAERTAANVSRILSKKYTITVFTFHGHVTYPFGGKLVDLKLPYNLEVSIFRKMQRLYKKLRAFRRVFRQEEPDVVLSFTEGPNIVALISKMIGLRAKYITNTQIPPSMSYKGIYRPVYAGMIRGLYGRADWVVALSEGVKADLIQNFHVPKKRVQVIYNPVDCDQIQSLSEEPVYEEIFTGDIPVVLNVGRLTPQKNQALLIRSFRRVRDNVMARLAIIGTGQLESKLRDLSVSLGLEDDVHFLGWKENPFKYMEKADLFVLSSDYEGLGNVLIEAMACGCPVISTDCPHGPAEILESGQYGVLVPVGDEVMLAEEIVHVLKDTEFHHTFAARGKQRARDFDMLEIAKQYDGVFTSLSL